MTQKNESGSQRGGEPVDSTRISSFMELRKETDRSVAIVGVAWLDGLLEACLKLHLRQPTSGDKELDKKTEKALTEIFQAEGPLGSFSAKCKMAYLLNIIGIITFGDLKIINDIRREFAHWMKAENPHRELEALSFKNNSISNRASNLQSKTPLKVLVKARLDDSEAARKYISAVDAIARGLQSYLAKKSGSETPASLP